MDKKFLIITLSAFLLIPKLVSANLIAPVSERIITPVSLLAIPLFPFIIVIETFVFWLLIHKWLKIQTGFWKLILVVLVANGVTSLLGTYVQFYEYAAENLLWISIAFVLSVFIEWGLYVPFFRKANVKRLDLLKISFIVNLATYIPIAIFIRLP